MSTQHIQAESLWPGLQTRAQTHITHVHSTQYTVHSTGHTVRMLQGDSQQYYSSRESERQDTDLLSACPRRRQKRNKLIPRQVVWFRV